MKFENVYGKSENGNIVCLGIRLENGNIGNIPLKGSKINNQALVGKKVVFYNKDKNKYYDIEVLEYIKGRSPRFVVNKYQDGKEKELQCGSFIKTCNIGNVVNEDLKTFRSLHKFRKVEDYYIMTIKTKGTKAEQDFNGQAVEILFDGSEEVVNSIMKSNWCLSRKGKSKYTYYISTGNYNQTKQNISLHQAVFNQKIPKGLVVNHISRNEEGWKDNRLSNLELATPKENTINRAGAGYPRKNGQSWCYQIKIEGFQLHSPTKRDYNEADIDSLIIQEHFNYTHRKDEWYKIKDVSQEYKDNLIKVMEQKLEKAKAKGSTFAKNEFEIVELDGVEVVKVFDTKSRFCLIDKENLWILNKGRVRQSGGYWDILINNTSNRLHRYLLGITETDKYHDIQVDHINQKPYDNRKENLRITTEVGNKANKGGKSYYLRDSNSYTVQYKSYHNILKQHNQISNITNPTFKTELEAKEEVYKRKYLVNYIIPKFKNLDEYLVFEEEYNTHKKDGQTLDNYWITTRFPNVNKIEIPKFSEENVDKL